MRCNYPQSRWIDGAKVYYPCGHCNACMVNRRNEKAVRGYLESRSHTDNCFLTLTYNDDNIPRNSKGIPTLRRSEFDDFIKRLRSTYVRENFRVLACGEYSPYPAFRPHYHCCLFGVSMQDIVSHTGHYHRNSGGIICEDFRGWFNSKGEVKGGVEVAPFSFKTASYVAKYLVKRTDKPDYEFLNIEPQFIYQSRRPALGYEFARQHREQLLADGFIRLNGHKFPIPRSIIERVLDKDSDDVACLKMRFNEKRQEKERKFNKELQHIYKGSSKHYFEQLKEVAEQNEIHLKGK